MWILAIAKRLPSVLMTFCWAMYCLAGEAKAETLEIEGKLLFEQYIGSDTPRRALTFDYQVKLQAKGWTIFVTNNNPQVIPYVFESCTWDGTNIYYQRHGEHPAAVAAKAVSGRPAGKKMDLATVYEGPVPAWSPGKQELLWMAYASSKFLDGVRTNRLPAIWSSVLPMEIVTKHHEAANWKRSERPPFLPGEIHYLTDSNTVKFINGKHQVVPRDQPEPQYTNAVYQVTEWVDYQGMTLPKAFVLTRRTPIKHGHKLMSVVTGTTLRVKMGGVDMAAQPLPLEGKKFILDYRTGAAQEPVAESAKYLATNWPSAQEALALQAPKMAPPDELQDRGSAVRMVIVIAVLLLSSGTVVFLVVGYNKQQKKESV